MMVNHWGVPYFQTSPGDHRGMWWLSGTLEQKWKWSGLLIACLSNLGRTFHVGTDLTDNWFPILNQLKVPLVSTQPHGDSLQKTPSDLKTKLQFYIVKIVQPQIACGISHKLVKSIQIIMCQFPEEAVPESSCFPRFFGMFQVLHSWVLHLWSWTLVAMAQPCPCDLPAAPCSNGACCDFFDGWGFHEFMIYGYLWMFLMDFWWICWRFEFSNSGISPGWSTRKKLSIIPQFKFDNLST